MKGTEQFKLTIKAYLDERAKNDLLHPIPKKTRIWMIVSHSFLIKQWLSLTREDVE